MDEVCDVHSHVQFRLRPRVDFRRECTICRTWQHWKIQDSNVFKPSFILFCLQYAKSMSTVVFRFGAPAANFLDVFFRNTNFILVQTYFPIDNAHINIWRPLLQACRKSQQFSCHIHDQAPFEFPVPPPNRREHTVLNTVVLLTFSLKYQQLTYLLTSTFCVPQQCSFPTR